jgi:hypothetical protein
MSKYLQAIDELERAVANHGDDPKIIAGLGYAYEVSGNKIKARETNREIPWAYHADSITSVVLGASNSGWYRRVRHLMASELASAFLFGVYLRSALL